MLNYMHIMSFPDQAEGRTRKLISKRFAANVTKRFTGMQLLLLEEAEIQKIKRRPLSLNLCRDILRLCTEEIRENMGLRTRHMAISTLK